MRLKLAALLCLWFGLIVNPPRLYAQSAIRLVLVCVTPTNPEDGAPYVIVFRNSSLFGLVIPISATVSVFSNQSMSVALQRITTDAATGGYKLGLEIMRMRSDSNLLDSTDCAEQISQVSQALKIAVNQNTLPVRVARQYGLTLQLGGEAKLIDPYLGVFGFQFTSGTDGHVTNLQVAQVSPSEPNIHISLSTISPATPTNYIIIGNKLFAVQKAA